jgi:AcrR family transcriptional regulator
MPKIVNHDARRKEIVIATWRVIARDGLAGTTIREIAREAGYSNGVLAHYFADRDEILASALIMAHRGVRDRTDIRIRDLRGLTALRLLLIESLPLDDQGLLEAKIEVSFWGDAVGNDKLRKIQNEEVDGFCSRIRTLVAQAAEDGELDDAQDIDAAVRDCHILVDGLSVQAVMYPARTSPSVQLERLEALLDRLRGPASVQSAPPGSTRSH